MLMEKWNRTRPGWLVVQGFRQRRGEDYLESFSPTPTHDTYISSKLELCLPHRLDLEETIYVELPEGKAKFDGAVGILKKPLYGIVQTSRNWNFLLVEALLELGLEQSEEDPCLFILIVDGKAVMIMI
ncbi:unnamed protein product, partial [Choristocarpus tenellus]